jgi:oligopeptide/dipeptide ABC transporter ATP-binding protein
MSAAVVELAAPLLDVVDLHTAFPGARAPVFAARGVSFAVEQGRTLGIVGESGSGKSVTLRSLIGLVPPPGLVVAGEVRWRGRDLLRVPARELRRIRGREISMIFQDPTSSLNPVFTIGDQIAETLRVKLGASRREARAQAVELLDHVGIPAAASRLAAYPHELSGGMRQRVMIAIAVACRPALLLADEPTTALDVTIQDQILALLAELQQEYRMALVLVSHDLGVVAEACDSVVVMYAGHVVEEAPAERLFAAPAHPYTRGLMRALPTLEPRRRGERGRLEQIPGQPPDLAALPAGCPFRPRCPYAREACAEVPMTLEPAAGGHLTACPFHEQWR